MSWWWCCGALTHHVYQYAEVGRVQTEMCRPFVAGTVGGHAFGGYTYAKLRIAGVARSVQTKLALHSCTTRYCLDGRTSCRGSVTLAQRCIAVCPRAPAPLAHFWRIESLIPIQGSCAARRVASSVACIAGRDISDDVCLSTAKASSSLGLNHHRYARVL